MRCLCANFVISTRILVALIGSRLCDESLEQSDNLPDPEVLAQEIVEAA